ncbi:MAG: TetR/AcrR family transcriptional regulator [Verrucomicrobiaceae bacterium]|nr:MAG: TetR/AcrR family transcriptional regulator [Verrucomicrobiaceae bacterium]
MSENPIPDPVPASAPELQPPRETKRMQTRRRVLEAALSVFQETDFESAGTAEIARRAGVSHGTVFTVEPTKERLAVAAFDGQLRAIGEAAFTAMLTATEPLPLLEQLDYVFEKLYTFYSVHRGVSRAIMREVLLTTRPDGPGDHDRLLKDFLDGLEFLLRVSITRGMLLPKTDTTALAGAIFGTYLLFLLALLNQAFPDDATRRQNCRQALQAILHGHSPAPLSEAGTAPPA